MLTFAPVSSEYNIYIYIYIACDMLCDRCKGPGAVTNCTSCSNNTGSAYQDQDNQGILLEFCSPIEGDARGSCRERNNCSLCRIESLHSYMMDSTFICESKLIYIYKMYI